MINVSLFVDVSEMTGMAPMVDVSFNDDCKIDDRYIFNGEGIFNIGCIFNVVRALWRPCVIGHCSILLFY